MRHLSALGRGEICKYCRDWVRGKTRRAGGILNYKDPIYNGITEWVHLETDLGMEVSNIRDFLA